MFPKAAYLKWKDGPQVGCVFARMISWHPARYGQVTERIPDAGTPKQVAGRIATRIEQLVNDRAVAAAALLFPKVSSLKALTQVALALGALPKWNVTTTSLQGAPTGEMVAIHIVREIPFGSASCPSAALVFGPFQDFPVTRQAPVPALEIFVGEPMVNDPKKGTPTKKAHLAHIDLRWDNDRMVKRVWNSTIDARKKALGGDDVRAKANISFVIPTLLAHELGCQP